MSITLITTVLGILSSFIPNLIRLVERKREFQHEIELTKLQIEAAKSNLNISKEIAHIKAVVDEGKSVRHHDLELSGGEFIDKLRASVRPVITYSLFGIFVGVKFAVAFIILMTGQLNIENMKLALDAIFDDNTMAITSTVIGYYFGARALEKMQETNRVTVTENLEKIK